MTNNYDKLESNGIVSENTYISSDDIIIGKTIPLKKEKDYLLSNYINKY